VGVRSLLLAVRASGRRKLIFCALWTEVWMAFPALDAVREGYEVSRVVDARAERVPGFVEIVLTDRLVQE
jgi:nicotinamidase-related amidase